MNKVKSWFANTSIRKKFVPMQAVMIILIVCISIMSINSVSRVNTMAQEIFTENVSDKDSLHSIIRTMYKCRVLGRDILLQEDPVVYNDLYVEYIDTFESLDEQMDEFAKGLSGDRLDDFNAIILEKNIYKDSMIESADIKIGGGEYDEALEALVSVTPIANEFFGSIDEFLAEEEALMAQALDDNDTLVLEVFVTDIFFSFFFILAVIVFMNKFARAISTSLVSLEKSVSSIAETSNMKIAIPKELFTKDEVGRIAVVVDKLKTMLLEYSFTDVLTGGYNVTAYREELADIFADQNNGETKRFWCILSDMNNLKLINDKLGHIEGDVAIKAAYSVINETFSQYGKTFRVGGDEFVSILFNCNQEIIEENFDKIDKRVERLNSHAIYRFAIARGYKEFVGNTQSEFDKVFEAVDKKMYENKHLLKEARLNARVTNGIRDDINEELNKELNEDDRYS